IYGWHLPEETGPALRLVEAACERRLDAVTFTSAPAVHNLFTIAGRDRRDGDLREAFNDDVVAGCVGSVCADGAREAGIRHPLAPSVGRLGLLVRALSEHFEARRRTLSLAGEEAWWRAGTLGVGDEVIELSGRERDLF